ncbi:MAG: hypothetical protein JW762_06425 [Dehalococcoidales bacterium]|nr:hypothetical protein [Dehalococcoidales bacterium]
MEITLADGTPFTHYMIDRIAQPTNHITDRHCCLAALMYAERVGVSKPVAVSIIMAKRRQWLTWHTLTQRQWQMRTRNKNKARFHDSISLREKYVRCKR